MENNVKSFKEYKQHAIQAAEDLGYGKTVIRIIRNSTSSSEIESVMRKARKKCLVRR